MLKNPAYLNPVQFGEAALAASRQVWLASLGATAVTRDWVQAEAGDVFKTLVKEGSVVESRAIRFVGDRFENSVTRANTVWKRTRKTVESSVKQAANAAVDFAQQVLPKSLPMFEQPVAKVAAKPATKAKRAVKRTAAKSKRKVKAAAKRA
jgi:polyhydroxyalkanoate synthesis regulator phasin